MAKQTVTVSRVVVRPHENADRLAIASVEGYDCVVGIPSTGKRLSTGDLVAYIPADSILPPELIRSLQAGGQIGKLAGKDANRVKPVRLRGVFSLGIVLEARPEWTEGQDVAEELGITKYEPPIPAELAGRVRSLRSPLDVPGRSSSPATLVYDIENARGYASSARNPFRMGEDVVITEKIHGTQIQVGLTAARPNGEREFFVTSKGLARQGVVLDLDSPENVNNLYVRMARHLDLEGRLRGVLGENPAPIVLIGEIFGAGVQDLHYGYNSARPETTGVRFFDLYIGTREHGRYLSDTYRDPASGAELRELDDVLGALQLPRVNVLYRGPYSPGVVELHTSGSESVSGRELHLREGVVVRPVTERKMPDLGRVQLKSISPDYLLRRGGTEYN